MTQFNKDSDAHGRVVSRTEPPKNHGVSVSCFSETTEKGGGANQEKNEPAVECFATTFGSNRFTRLACGQEEADDRGKKPRSSLRALARLYTKRLLKE